MITRTMTFYELSRNGEVKGRATSRNLLEKFKQVGDKIEEVVEQKVGIADDDFLNASTFRKYLPKDSAEAENEPELA